MDVYGVNIVTISKAINAHFSASAIECYPHRRRRTDAFVTTTSHIKTCKFILKFERGLEKGPKYNIDYI